jgi:uncharacterized protein (TIGR02996 family)
METVTLIPTEWRQALNDAPDDLTLRSALADWFAEQGNELAAECLKWSVEKERTPKEYCYGGWQWECRIFSGSPMRYLIPKSLHGKPPALTEDYSLPSDAFDRLIGKWRHSTPEKRQEYWKWEPK